MNNNRSSDPDREAIFIKADSAPQSPSRIPHQFPNISPLIKKPVDVVGESNLPAFRRADKPPIIQGSRVQSLSPATKHDLKNHLPVKSSTLYFPRSQLSKFKEEQAALMKKTSSLIRIADDESKKRQSIFDAKEKREELNQHRKDKMIKEVVKMYNHIKVFRERRLI